MPFGGDQFKGTRSYVVSSDSFADDLTIFGNTLLDAILDNKEILFEAMKSDDQDHCENFSLKGQWYPSISNHQECGVEILVSYTRRPFRRQKSFVLRSWGARNCFLKEDCVVSYPY